MSELEADVVIVGAGPAGSTAAFKLSELGLSVIVIDKKQELGTPKRCAEGISYAGMQKVGLEPDPIWAINKITSSVIFSPSMKEVWVRPKDMMGFVVERKVMEKHLAAKAIRAGAKYLIKTHVTDVIIEDGRVAGVLAHQMGEKIRIRSKIVVAADGVDSMTAKRAGIDTLNNMESYHSGFQYEMANVDVPTESLHLFFGKNIAPGGYIWIFPKGPTLANVGIGISSSESGKGKRAKELLDRFIKNNPRFFSKASPVEMNAGGIPMSVSVKTFVGDGIMLLGDAAHQVNPIHGGGIALGMNAAHILAEVAKKAIDEGDLSRDRLMEYERIWNDTDGKKMRRLGKVKSFLDKLNDEDFERLSQVLSGDEIQSLVIENDIKVLLKVLVGRAPKLLLLAKRCLG